ncbi:MAG: hypothetical protein K0U98_11720 [Deltaproteobacteria bacterium]|nr:hypothetical protein [Deltaproteobacteria bacterium]
MSSSPPKGEAVVTAGGAACSSLEGTDHRLENLLGRIEIRSPEDIRVDGFSLPDTEIAVPQLEELFPGCEVLVYHLLLQIYGQLYCRRSPASAWPLESEASAQLIDSLKEIHQSRACTVKGSFRDDTAGWFGVFGWMTPDWVDHRPLVRLYWNLATPEGAEPLLARLTADCDRFRVPFQLKVQVDPSQFDRVDTAVLYVEKQYFQIIAELASRAHQSLRYHLLSPTPVLTKFLRPGLALAEDPGGGLSFGLSRCRLLAEAVAAAHHSGYHSALERFRIFQALCHRRGLDPARLYLNPGSVDLYHLPSPLNSVQEVAA